MRDNARDVVAVVNSACAVFTLLSQTFAMEAALLRMPATTVPSFDVVYAGVPKGVPATSKLSFSESAQLLSCNRAAGCALLGSLAYCTRNSCRQALLHARQS